MRSKSVIFRILPHTQRLIMGRYVLVVIESSRSLGMYDVGLKKPAMPDASLYPKGTVKGRPPEG